MKKKFRKAAAILGAAALFTGTLAIPAAAEDEGGPFSICIITSSGVDDGSFNQDCYDGIKTFIADHPDCTVKDIKEGDLTQLIPTVEKSVGDYDVFVLPGFNFSTVGDIVLDNPDKDFIVVDNPVTDSEGNPVTEDNLYTMALLFGAIESIRTGQQIDVQAIYDAAMKA